MAKKQTTKKRTQVKDLPKKEKKLSAKDMKKVKGGLKFDGIDGEIIFKKPGTIK
ncbi:MAG: hypothetical protein H7Y30_05425 [Pyrinomonadaceae bacterium]|nr:hypothetical protein [Pyrinomonadaceae bacterium]